MEEARELLELTRSSASTAGSGRGSEELPRPAHQGLTTEGGGQIDGEENQIEEVQVRRRRAARRLELTEAAGSTEGGRNAAATAAAIPSPRDREGAGEEQSTWLGGCLRAVGSVRPTEPNGST